MSIENLILHKEKIINSHSKEDCFNIFFTTDEKYAKFTGISIYSIIDNNKKEYINFHLFVSGISLKDIELLKNLKTDYINITLYYINSKFFSDLYTCGHFSQAVYYRLAIPNILNDYKKLLYLDVDTICLGNVSDLFNIELDDKIIGAVEDYNIDIKHLNNLSFNKKDQYFNSGILLINTQKWNDEKIYSQLIELIIKNKFSYPDQDALNLLLIHKKQCLAEKFNWTNWYRTPQLLNLSNKNITFAHFIGEIKPWHKIGFHSLYDFYKQESPWRNEKYLEPENTKMYGKYSRTYWRKKDYIKSLKYQFFYIIRKLLKIK